MILYLFIFSSFILPLVYSGNGTLSTQESNSNSLTHPDNGGTKLVLHSEGGTLLASTPDLLPRDKQLNSLLALDGELAIPKETSVKARKGVGNDTDGDNKTVLKTSNYELQNNTVNLKTVNENNESHVIKSKVIANVHSETLAISKPINSTEAPKKPLILSYEALVNADKSIQNEIKIPATNPSSKILPNIAKSQIPSPNEDVVKVYPSKANSHPGMIMPIVITILVVPMFAIVGYLALRRGQEAWKNRHYKRMDFLLDGMYND